MAAALPVSTCKIGGIAETVVEGQTGLVFEPGNIEQQADTFIQLANDEALRQRLSVNARKRVEKHFTLEIEAQRFLEILTQES
jgi:glycosyltransferase involved in cell wall biosynthesis